MRVRVRASEECEQEGEVECEVNDAGGDEVMEG